MEKNVERTLVMTDIHGTKDKLEEMLKLSNYSFSDNLIFLGDYVDRGADSKGVIDLIIKLKKSGNVTCLLGNHDDWFLRFLKNEIDLENLLIWYGNGGYETLQSYNLTMTNRLREFSQLVNWYLSYGRRLFFYENMGISLSKFIEKEYDKPVNYFLDSLNEIRDYIVSNYESHIEFLNSLNLYSSDANFYYAHGGCNLNYAQIELNSKDDLIWTNRDLFFSSIPHLLDKPIVVGHTVVSTISSHKSDGIFISRTGDKIGIDGGIVFGHKMFCLVIDNLTGTYDSLEIV